MIVTAIPAGFAAGLFGIGGGLITVPILFYIFSISGIEQAYLMHLAVGTSFWNHYSYFNCLSYNSSSAQGSRF